MGFVDFVIAHEWVILFYSVIILLIIAVREHIQWQGFAVGLYRTKVGIALMERWGKKYRGLIQIIGMIGIGVGFVGMGMICFTLIQGLWALLTDPAAPPVIAPVLPGFSIPGFDLKVPLVTGWIALFIVIVIHEFSHGVVSKAHNVKVKSSGLLIFGPIAGAFVEPDENVLKNQPETTQYALFAAGPVSNFITAFLAMGIMALLFAPAINVMTVPSGVEITKIVDGYGAANASLVSGDVVTSINGVDVLSYEELSTELDTVFAGDAILVGLDDERVVSVQTTQNPADATSNRGYLGVNLKSSRDARIGEWWFTALLAIVVWFQDLFYWFVLLSLGIGLANLLPIGPLDGGRMLQLATNQITGNKKRGDWWWAKISLVTLALILILLLIPIGRALF